jgi:DNA-binding CsgD family transcriptional regulator
MAENPLGELTAKQREVLDLLIQHKTSKEISRILGISPHTVDQRIMLARGKLNVATRSEVAHAYRKLVEENGQQAICERSVYDDSHIAIPPRLEPVRGQEDAVIAAHSAETAPRLSGETVSPDRPYYHVLPEMFDGPYGTLARLGYIATVTVFLIVAVLGGLSMYAQLASIVDR